MRTPNSACIVCGKRLYRRPTYLARVRHVACMAHRAEAQKRSGITQAQQAGLSLGRRKGTNNRTGYQHREESKAKASASHKAYCAANPEKVAERSEKTRGERHYRWGGGVSKSAQSIRRMTEYRKWAAGVRQRDGFRCVRCGSRHKLESHHTKAFSELLARHEITSRDAARNCSALWDLSIGITLCEACHYQEHGRKYEDRRIDIQQVA